MKEGAGVDLRFLRRLWRVTAAMCGPVRSLSALLAVVVIAVVFANEALVYLVGMVPSNLITGLVRRDATLFFDVLWRAALYTVAEAVIVSLIVWGSGTLALWWRRRLVAHLQERYLRGRRFYSVLNDVDNPDQRIVEDASLLCTTLAGMLSSASVLGVIAFYTQQTAALLGWIGPVTVYVYFLLGSVVNRLLMSRVAQSVWRQEKYEGSFRFGHARLRGRSEQIALCRGGAHERAVLHESFAIVLTNGMQLLRRRFALGVSQNLFVYVGGLLSYAVVGLVLRFGTEFDGRDPAELASLLQQSAFLSIMLISGFSTLVTLASTTADLAGYTARVAQLLEALDAMPEENNVEEAGASDSELVPCLVEEKEEESQAVRFEHVTVSTPDGTLLVEDVSFEVSAGDSLLITGPSGSGKSSLVRVLHGLWQPRNGRVVKPADSNLCFVPQEPYLVTGTLVDQIAYPTVGGKSVCEDEAAGLLRLLGMDYLCERFSVGSDVLDWATVLSPGERQKVSIARLIRARPLFGVLDESTSALSLEDEAGVYALLKQRGISVISVGHRPSLRPFHRLHLQLGKNGTWRLDAEEAPP
jgi:ATP-binding cassette subfamily D (ALD) protein 4